MKASLFSRVVLLLLGLMFVSLGVWCFSAPQAVAALLEYRIETPAATAEFRAVYGGMEIGLGAALCLAAFMSREAARGALLIAAVTFLGVSGCRTAALAMDGSAATQGMLGLLAIEALSAFLPLAAWGYGREKK